MVVRDAIGKLRRNGRVGGAKIVLVGPDVFLEHEVSNFKRRFYQGFTPNSPPGIEVKPESLKLRVV